MNRVSVHFDSVYEKAVRLVAISINCQHKPKPFEYGTRGNMHVAIAQRLTGYHHALLAVRSFSDSICFAVIAVVQYGRGSRWNKQDANLKGCRLEVGMALAYEVNRD